MEFTSAAFWAALGSIVLANILLSGDNAVVIALAARGLPAHQQKKAIFWGSAAAIVMRIALTVLAAEMLTWPYLKIVGGLLLLYIAVSLILDDDSEEDGTGKTVTGGLFAAVRTILVADLVMSLDNVLAVAAAANGDMMLLVIGLAISIPLIIAGSTMLLKVIERFPILITIGAALLGFLAGEMELTDPAVENWVGGVPHDFVTAAGVAGGLLVIVTAYLLRRRARAQASSLR